MANVVNDRDVLIMGTSPRFTPATDRGMFITPSSAVFKVSADGATASPASYTFQVTLLNLTGTVAFSSTSGLAPTVNGNTVTLSYANMSAVSGTITATITVDGQLYTAIANVTKVADGTIGQNGIRGNVDIAAVTSGSVWSDSEAAAALTAAGYGAPQVRDLVKLYRSDRTFSVQRMYNGSAWVTVDYVYDGSVFVKGSILPEAIDTRGLTIKDAQGNVILGSGTGLPTAYAAPGTLNSDLTPSITAAANTAVWTSVSNRPTDDSIKNNLIDLSWWARGASLAWTPNGETNSIVKCSPVSGADLLMPGPKGSDDAIWYCKEVTGDSGPGGGWEGPYYSLDKTKTYRFVVPIRRIGGTGQAYWGTHGVADLNTTSLNSNPYFVNGLTVPATDRWYLFVGYIYPANSTANTHDSAGVWDCRTGAKILTGYNYCFMPDGQQVMHRAYQFYANLNAEQLFGRPMINLVDGTEPSLREYFDVTAVLNSQQQWGDVSGTGKPADNATADIKLVARGSCSVAGNLAAKGGGVANWDSDVYSIDSFTGGAYASAVVSTTTGRLMFGLNSDPTTDTNYTSLDYAIYLNGTPGGDGNIYIYESASNPATFGAYAVGDVFAVVYDGSSVKYLKNGAVFYTSAVGGAANQKLFFDSAFLDPGVTLSNIRFGPMSSNNWVNVGGTGKPADYATVSGADAATSLGFNPQFSNWTGTWPAGWNSWGSSPTKETGTVRTSPYAVRWTTTGSDTGMVAGTGFQTPLPAGTFVQGAFDITIITNNGGGAPGYLIRLYTDAAQTVYTDTLVQVPDKTVTGWQHVPFTARVPSGQRIWAITIYQMASWTGMPGGSWATGSVCIFDNLTFDFRDSSTDANALVPSINSAAATAVWSSVSGSGKPADNATVGATIGTNLFGQMNAGNISTFIAGAAIDLALINKASIGSLSALTAIIGTLRTATSGARTEISDNVIKVFDTSNQLRVRLGDLSL